MKQIAFIFEDLNPSQVAYNTIFNINKELSNRSDVEPAIFFSEQSMPCILPFFARYNVRDIPLYTGNLIATSLKTAILLGNAARAKRYFYIQDLEWLRPWCNLDTWKGIMSDKDIVKICRSEDHANAIAEYGFGLKPIVIENYDIMKFMELFNNG